MSRQGSTPSFKGLRHVRSLGPALALSVLAATSVYAGDTWHCRNEAVEVSCNAGKCEVSKDFTPLDVTVDSETGLTVCAYSGCWEGKLTSMLASQNHLTVQADDMKWSTSVDKKGIPGSVTIDRKSGTGTVLASSFAVPVTCRKAK